VALADSLDTGDIVLFSRPCTRMGIFGGFLCFSTKLFHDTPWDHIGVVVRDSAGTNQLWDAGFNGVQHHDLRERLLRSSANEIAVRRLQCSRDDSFRAVARAYMRDEIENRPYKVSNLQLMRVAVDFHPSKNERRQLYYELLCAEDSARELRAHLLQQQQQQLSALQSLLLQQRLQTVTAAAAQLRSILSSTDRSALENSSDHESLFCSELVAALYQKLGLLDAVYPSSNEFLPSDFASEHQINRVLLRKGAKLHIEQFLRCADKRKLLHSVATTNTDNNSSVITGTSSISSGSTDTTAVQAVTTADNDTHSGKQLQTQKPLAAAVSNIKQSLKKHPVLSQLSDDTLTAVAQKFKATAYAAEQCIAASDNSTATATETDADCIVVFENGTADLHAETSKNNNTTKPDSTSTTANNNNNSNNSSGNSSDDLNTGPSTTSSNNSSSSSSAAKVVTYGAHNCFDTALTVPHSSSSSSSSSKHHQQQQWRLIATAPVKCWTISKPVLQSVCKHDAAAMKVVRNYKPKQHSSADAQMIAAVLKQHPVLMQLLPHEQQQLSKQFHPLHFSNGDCITQSGEYADSVYILTQGEARRTVHSTYNANSTTTVATDASTSSTSSSRLPLQYTVIKQGACFGDTALNTVQDSTVKCTTRDCKVLALSKYNFAHAVPAAAAPLVKSAFDACASCSSDSSGKKRMTVHDFVSLLELQQQSTDTPVTVTAHDVSKLFTAVGATSSRNSSNDSDMMITYGQFMRLDMLLSSPTAHVSTTVLVHTSILV
jgi:CRP-like cAMP-binding protein